MTIPLHMTTIITTMAGIMTPDPVIID